MDSVADVNASKMVKGMIWGLVLMTVFTFFWSGVAFYGMSHNTYRWLLLIFPILCFLFIYYIFKLTVLSKHIPQQPKAESTEAEKKKSRLFLIAMTSEGLGVFIAINVAANLHHPELEIPAVALIVGLHFFPLAKVFDRKMDYYIGAWTVIIAILAIILTLNHTFNEATALAFTGIGLAIATSIYGLNMVFGAQSALSVQHMQTS